MTGLHQIARETRERRQFTLNDLAARTGLPLASLQRFESGEPALSTAQIARVAETLGLEFAALLRGRMVETPRASVFFRHGSYTDFSSDDETVVAEALDDATHFLTLRKTLEEPVSLRRSSVFTRRNATGATHKEHARDGYRLASSVRSRLFQRGVLHSENAPLGGLRALLEDVFEILVVVRSLRSTRTSALLAAVPESGGCVVILNDEDPERRRNPRLDRVHLAHELCHALFDPTESGQLHLVVESNSSASDERNERRAKAFAAEFLIPEKGAKALLQSRTTTSAEVAWGWVNRVREHFGTPTEIAVQHLHNRRFYDEDIRDQLLKRKGVGQAASVEALPGLHEKSIALRTMTERAHKASLISDGQARTVLGLGLIDRLAWMNE